MGTETITERSEGENAAPETAEQDNGQDLVAERGEEFAAEHADTVEWLENEFPDWVIEVAATSTWSEDLRPIWIAHKDGHHPQSELTAGKLYTRLSEYLERENQRKALMN